METKMKVEDNLQNEDNWNSSKLHPYQTTMMIATHGSEKYKFFTTNSGKEYLVYFDKIGPLKVASLKFPEIGEEGIREFIKYCKKKRYLYQISSFDKIDFLKDYYEGFTTIIDLALPYFQKGIKSNIKKATKEGVEVKKLEKLEEWEKQNEIHNSLLERKEIRFNEKDRKEIYKKLYDFNNKNTILYGAFHNDKMIAGILIAYTKEYGLFFKSATLKEYYSFAPGPLIIKKICDNENKRFKFLDMNIGIEGKYKTSEEIVRIIEFKKRFGHEKKIYIYSSPWYLRLRKLKIGKNG